MGLTKHASFAVLSARIAPEGGGPLMRTAHRHEFEYEPKPGFLYVRSRMISSRTNDNYDHFPADEIKKAYKTFVGKPVFVNHHNDNHRRARGVIKDAVLHEDVNPDGSQDTWVEGLMEVDAVRFPKLAQAILAGHIDRTSMGTDVQFSVCSVCNNKAASPVDYCKHIPKMKGQKVWRTTASGEKEAILVYEKCYGLGFFENSLLVEEPADPTAYFLGVDDRGVRAMGLAKAAAKQPLVPGHTVEWTRNPGPDGKYRARCSCGETFPGHDEVGDAYIDALSHGGRGNPAYDDADVNRREHEMHNRPPQEKSRPGRNDVLPSNYNEWTGTNPDNWVLVASKTARGEAQEAWNREHDEVDQLLHHRSDPTRPHAVSCVRCRWHGTSDQIAICPRCEETDEFTWATNTEPDQLSSRYRSPGAQTARCSCGWVGTQSQVARCPRCEDGSALVFNDPVRDRFASRTAGADEKTLAPADVDTLRDENCPVCGEASAYDGEKCQVCGFVTPPSEFGDPDTDAAKATDLRQENDDANDKGGDLACDSCGATFASEAGTKTALVLDPDKGTEDSDDAASTQSQAGDTCPTCGEGTLQPAAAPDAADDGADGADADGFAPAGSAGAEEAAASADDGDAQDDADDPDGPDGADDEDGEDGDQPDFLKKKKDKKKPTANRTRVSDVEGADVDMRPALAALAAQQKQIEALAKQNQALRSAVAFIADVAGISGHQRITSALKTAVDDNPAFGGGWENMEETAPKAPVETTQQAATPTAKDDVENVGSTPLTDVTPDATTSLADTGVTLDVTEPTKDDVTAPVAGTETLGQGERGQAGTNTTETEVRVGQPSDNSAAFRDGGFLGSTGRTIASLRLARLQIQAGIAAGDDLDLGQAIAASEMPDEAIQGQIETLSKVVTATRQPQRVARNLVPQGASQAQRMVPSMTATAASAGESLSGVSDSEMLFE